MFLPAIVAKYLDSMIQASRVARYRRCYCGMFLLLRDAKISTQKSSNLAAKAILYSFLAFRSNFSFIFIQNRRLYVRLGNRYGYSKIETRLKISQYLRRLINCSDFTNIQYRYTRVPIHVNLKRISSLNFPLVRTESVPPLSRIQKRNKAI